MRRRGFTVPCLCIAEHRGQDQATIHQSWSILRKAGTSSGMPPLYWDAEKCLDLLNSSAHRLCFEMYCRHRSSQALPPRLPFLFPEVWLHIQFSPPRIVSGQPSPDAPYSIAGRGTVAHWRSWVCALWLSTFLHTSFRWSTALDARA